MDRNSCLIGFLIYSVIGQFCLVDCQPSSSSLAGPLSRPVEVFVNVYDHPKTGFSCQGKNPGQYYADPATKCAVYYVCIPNPTGLMSAQSFACPNGTIFSQATRVCRPHEEVFCPLASRYYDSDNGKIDTKMDPIIMQDMPVVVTSKPSGAKPQPRLQTLQLPKQQSPQQQQQQQSQTLQHQQQSLHHNHHHHHQHQQQPKSNPSLSSVNTFNTGSSNSGGSGGGGRSYRQNSRVYVPSSTTTTSTTSTTTTTTTTTTTPPPPPPPQPAIPAQPGSDIGLADYEYDYSDYNETGLIANAATSMLQSTIMSMNNNLNNNNHNHNHQQQQPDQIQPPIPSTNAMMLINGHNTNNNIHHLIGTVNSGTVSSSSSSSSTSNNNNNNNNGNQNDNIKKRRKRSENSHQLPSSSSSSLVAIVASPSSLSSSSSSSYLIQPSFINNNKKEYQKIQQKTTTTNLDHLISDENIIMEQLNKTPLELMFNIDPIENLGRQLALPLLTSSSSSLLTSSSASYQVSPEKFNCEDKIPGLAYADIEMKCEKFFICLSISKGKLMAYSFDCEQGKWFNQQKGLCENYYDYNENDNDNNDDYDDQRLKFGNGEEQEQKNRQLQDRKHKLCQRSEQYYIYNKWYKQNKRHLFNLMNKS